MLESRMLTDTTVVEVSVSEPGLKPDLEAYIALLQSNPDNIGLLYANVAETAGEDLELQVLGLITITKAILSLYLENNSPRFRIALLNAKSYLGARLKIPNVYDTPIYLKILALEEVLIKDADVADVNFFKLLTASTNECISQLSCSDDDALLSNSSFTPKKVFLAVQKIYMLLDGNVTTLPLIQNLVNLFTKNSRYSYWHSEEYYPQWRRELAFLVAGIPLREETLRLVDYDLRTAENQFEAIYPILERLLIRLVKVGDLNEFQVVTSGLEARTKKIGRHLIYRQSLERGILESLSTSYQQASEDGRLNAFITWLNLYMHMSQYAKEQESIKYLVDNYLDNCSWKYTEFGYLNVLKDCITTLLRAAAIRDDSTVELYIAAIGSYLTRNLNKIKTTTQTQEFGYSLPFAIFFNEAVKLSPQYNIRYLLGHGWNEIWYCALDDLRTGSEVLQNTLDQHKDIMRSHVVVEATNRLDTLVTLALETAKLSQFDLAATYTEIPEQIAEVRDRRFEHDIRADFEYFLNKMGDDGLMAEGAKMTFAYHAELLLNKYRNQALGIADLENLLRAVIRYIENITKFPVLHLFISKIRSENELLNIFEKEILPIEINVSTEEILKLRSIFGGQEGVLAIRKLSRQISRLKSLLSDDRILDLVGVDILKKIENYLRGVNLIGESTTIQIENIDDILDDVADQISGSWE